MKKLILSALLLFAFSNCFSQFFMIGPRAGVSSSDFTIGDINPVGSQQLQQQIRSGEARLGFHAGIFSRISIAGFYVQPEVLFTNAGGQLIENYNTNQGAQEAVLNYNYNKLDVPVLVGYKFFDFLRVQAGPSFSYLLSSDVREDATGQARDVIANYNKSTVGYRAGIGLDIWKLIIDLNYEGSLGKYTTSISSPAGDFATDQRQNQFILSVGFNLFEL